MTVGRTEPDRRRLLLIAVVLVPLGVGTKVYTGPGADWVVGHLGGAFYVAFWCILALLVRPTLSPRRVASVVLAGTCGLEALQLWHPPFLEGARRTLVGQALLGSTFSWVDVPYYVAGAAVAVGLSAWARTTASRNPS